MIICYKTVHELISFLLKSTSPGAPCERCSTLPAAGPIPWPTTCDKPDCRQLINNGK